MIAALSRPEDASIVAYASREANQRINPDVAPLWPLRQSHSGLGRT